MRAVRLVLGGVALSASGLGGCLLVDGFSNYDLDGGPVDATTDARGDATSDTTPDTTRDARRDRVSLEASGDAGCGTASDPLNCGTCGHDCVGGECTGGVCQPVPLMTGLRSPRAITSTSVGVYFAESVPDSGVYLWRYDAGADAVSLVAAHQDQPLSLAASDRQVFWTTNSGVRACPLGEAPCDAGVFDSDASATQIDVGPTAVCWTSSPAGTLTCAPLDGGAPVELKGLSSPAGVRVGTNAAFFTTLGTGGDAGTVQKAPLMDITAPLTLASGQQLPQRVALHPAPTLPGWIYWTNLGALGDGGATVTFGTVMSCDTVFGCKGVEIATVDRPVGIVVDKTSVYFVSSKKSGAVAACPSAVVDASCGLPATIAPRQEGPTDLAEDKASLFWTDLGGGTVMRMAKPDP